MSILIDKEFESLIPPLSAEEFQQLEENCLRDGIRDALIVWEQDGNDILIDGHNRFKIAAKHGLQWDEKLGFPRGSICKWDKNIPSVLKVKAVADALHTTVDALLKKDDE